MLNILSCVCLTSVHLLWRNVYLGLLIFVLGCLLFLTVAGISLAAFGYRNTKGSCLAVSEFFGSVSRYGSSVDTLNGSPVYIMHQCKRPSPFALRIAIGVLPFSHVQTDMSCLTGYLVPGPVLWACHLSSHLIPMATLWVGRKLRYRKVTKQVDDLSREDPRQHNHQSPRL